VMVVAVGFYVLSQAINAQLLSDAEEWLGADHSELWLGLALLGILILLRIGSWVHKADTVIFKPEHTVDRQ